MKTLLAAVGAVAAVYLLLVAGLAAAMMQPPDRFGRIMAKVPSAAFPMLPFRPLWLNIRAGSLQVGDPAPHFALETADRSSRVRLSAYRGHRPVVLVFGSYT